MTTAANLDSLPDPAPRPTLALVAVPSISDRLEFEAALQRATPRLVRYAARRLQNVHEAEEAVQEALLRACQHSPGFPTEDDLNAWLTVVTGRLVIDRLRVRGRSVPMAEVPPTARMGRDTADVVVARDEARAALDALEAMPSRQAAVLWAREVEGLSYDEISRRFALSEPTVRSLLHRARLTLRREYAARGGTLPVGGVLALLAPWRRGLHAVARLRRVARAAAAPLSLAVAGLTLGTMMLLPDHSAITPAAGGTVSPVQLLLPTATSAHQVTSAHPARTAPLAPPTGVTRAAAPHHRFLVPLPVASCPRSETRAVGVTGVGCLAAAPQENLVIAPALPIAHRRVVVGNPAGLCSLPVPTTAVARCTTNSTQSGATR